MLPGSRELEGVIATELLERRAPRVCDALSEARAMEELERALAGSPRALLQRLSGVAMELCHAQSAGVSLLEEAEGRRYFRWHAVAGAWTGLLWSTLPREFSPCGTVLDRNQALLMVDPVRYFTPLEQVQPAVHEALLLPFTVDGETVGTVWVIAHDGARKFDAEDRRIVCALTAFAAAAYRRLLSLGTDDVQALSRLYRGKKDDAS